MFVPRRKRAGEHIYDEGDPAEAIWYVRSGTVALVRSHAGGGERVRALRGEGAIIGLETLVGETHVDSARAATGVTVCVLCRSSLGTWLGDGMTPARVLLEQTARALLADTPRGAGPDGTATRRVARWILDESAPSVPRGVVASLLGMTPATLSRALAELERAGAIELSRKSCAVRDPPRLLRAAGLDDDATAPVSRAGPGARLS